MFSQIPNLYKFFDYFGLPIFAFIFLEALCEILKEKPTWRSYARLVIGFAGIIVDGYLVFFN